MKPSVLFKYISVYLFILSINQSINQSNALTAITFVNQKNVTVQMMAQFDHTFAEFGPRQSINGQIVFFDQYNNHSKSEHTSKDDDSSSDSNSDPDYDELCEIPDLSDDQLGYINRKIFVVRRSYIDFPNSCSFVTKAKNAQTLGARAVIIANRVRPPQSDDSTDDADYEVTTDSSGQPFGSATVDKYRDYGDLLVSMGDDGTHEKISIDVIAITNDAYEYLHSMYYEQSNNQTVYVDIDASQSLNELTLPAARWLSVLFPMLFVVGTIMSFITAMNEYYREQSLAQAAAPASAAPDFIPEDLSEVAVENHPSAEDEDDDDDNLDFDDDLDELINQSNHLSFRDRIDEAMLRSFSYLSKPQTIHSINQIVYSLEIVMCTIFLAVFWDELCSLDLHALTSLFLCRAVMGARVVFWQTHSDTPPPGCSSVFVKNWCDYVFLFSGAAEIWSAGADCSAESAHLFRLMQVAVLLVWLTYILRVGLFFALKCTSLHLTLAQQEQGGSDANEAADVSAPPRDPSVEQSANPATPTVTPPSHIFTLGRVLLDVLNGGFYCAGQLDTARPATAMDLRWLPTVTYKPGLSFKRRGESDQQDMSCSICMQEYEPGEVIRLLYCQRKAIHHFHQACVDQWLLRNATCPLCRSAVSQERSEQQRHERAQARERRRQRRERRTNDSARGGYQQVENEEELEMV